ncbi:hypothetical protein [Maribacter sp. 2304DJ31-5]|uniref:hypothetical protein n=1 Tax=Maribacter sp. 2304DJ31-5 TaxID=3386273 RepID=UPI0039BD7065
MKFYRLLLICIFFLGAFMLVSQEKKSSITINNPKQGTVWTIPELVGLEWEVQHMNTEKSTRFFLVRNEMVVQELGSFKNTGSIEGIELAKNIDSGDRYQVVGIELFPDNKYNVAKFVTPFFAIVNKASDERKRKQELAAIPITSKKKKKTKKRKKEKPKQKIAQLTIGTNPKTDIRQEFNGRKISYTKELVFNDENISVKIWDHGRQDGDIVSIYLNGNSVVSKYHLTYWKKEFKIKLDPNKSNDLFLYAHNLGKAPPNTVSIEITDGNKSENIILNSDLQSCEAVMISVKK